MNHRQEETVKVILDLLLSLPWSEREEVCSAIRFNRVFCFSCGMGQETNPNPNCQCQNDE